MVLAKRAVRGNSFVSSNGWWPKNATSIFTSHGGDFKKHALWAGKETWKSSMKAMGTLVMCIDTRPSQAVWAKAEESSPHCTHVWLSRTCNEDEDIPNELYILVTYVPATMFKNLQLKWMRTNFQIKLQNCQKKRAIFDLS